MSALKQYPLGRGTSALGIDLGSVLAAVVGVLMFALTAGRAPSIVLVAAIVRAHRDHALLTRAS